MALNYMVTFAIISLRFRTNSPLQVEMHSNLKGSINSSFCKTKWGSYQLKSYIIFEVFKILFNLSNTKKIKY